MPSSALKNVVPFTLVNILGLGTDVTGLILITLKGWVIAVIETKHNARSQRVHFLIDGSFCVTMWFPGRNGLGQMYKKPE